MSGQPTFLRLPALFTCLVISCSAFSPSLTSTTIYKKAVLPSHFRLNAESGSVVAEKAAPVINGEALELLLMDFDEPLVIDAYADWCGPCQMMAPEFEDAAKELKGKVRFVKLDTDLDPEMSDRLGINGLPTLLFLDKFVPEGNTDDDQGASVVLKERIEGAIQKKSIVDLCEHHFFDGERPEQLM